MLRSLAAVAALVGASAAAQSAGDTTFFAHPDAPYYVAGQVNLITQAHPAFPALYSGTNSLSPDAEAATSFLATFYSALSLSRWTEAIVHVEMTSGGGLSTALGLGGFTNLDVVRNPTLGSEPYLARAMVRQVIPLGGEEVEVARGPLGAMARAPSQRLELRLGKLSTVDFFDANSYGSDNQHQFSNWTVDNGGGYDYAADTRGYTYGLLAEYHRGPWVAYGGLMLMPKVANGLELDFDVTRARAENLELERAYAIAGRPGVVRALVYFNHANMGSYREAIDAWKAGVDARPDITAHRQQGRLKYGFGLNVEQTLAGPVRAFGRATWNEGAFESFAYTEVNDSFEVGVDLDARFWHRENDRAAIAFVSNGLSADHREYLADGGLGFLLGDGALSYGRETIVEAYYTAHLWRGLFASIDFQFIENPGYNHDRGPAIVGGARLHADL